MESRARQPTTKAPGVYFTGDVWLDVIAQGHGDSPLNVAAVHFAPGARTAWHSHSIGQTLQVTEGEGRIQSRGEPIVTMRPGDVYFTPGEEWHWHGAGPHHFMTHLSVAEGDAQWGEHVTDAEYEGTNDAPAGS